MKSNVRRWLLIPAMALAVAAVFAALLILRKPAVQPVSVHAERAAADLLLKKKLSGPRYFNAPAQVASDDDELWIGAEEAWSQVPRIAAERKFGPEAAKELGRIIVQLCEPHPYRMVGGQRVSLLRLNLSLDAIK